MSTSVGVHEAKTNLSALPRRVEAGEEIEICRSGEPVALLVPLERPIPRFGMDKGRLNIPDNFNDPLPPELLELFYR